MFKYMLRTTFLDKTLQYLVHGIQISETHTFYSKRLCSLLEKTPYIVNTLHRIYS